MTFYLFRQFWTFNQTSADKDGESSDSSFSSLSGRTDRIRTADRIETEQNPDRHRTDIGDTRTRQTSDTIFRESGQKREKDRTLLSADVWAIPAHRQHLKNLKKIRNSACYFEFNSETSFKTSLWAVFGRVWEIDYFENKLFPQMKRRKLSLYYPILVHFK